MLASQALLEDAGVCICQRGQDGLGLDLSFLEKLKEGQSFCTSYVARPAAGAC